MKRALSCLSLSLSVAVVACGGAEELSEEDLAELEEVGSEDFALSSHARSIQNLHSGKCLDIPWGSSADWEDVNQFNCHGGGAQQFVVELVYGIPGQTATGYQIRNVTTNKCVRPEGTAAPGFTPQSLPLVQGPCDGYYAVWRKRDPVALGGGAERTSFAWDHDAIYCMDVPGDRWWQDGAQLQMYRQCHGGALQRFDVRP